MNEYTRAVYGKARVFLAMPMINGQPVNDWWVKESMHDAAVNSASAKNDELLEALLEARSWIGDGDNSDGLHRDHWSEQYKAAVDMIDNVIKKYENRE